MLVILRGNRDKKMVNIYMQFSTLVAVNLPIRGAFIGKHGILNCEGNREKNSLIKVQLTSFNIRSFHKMETKIFVIAPKNHKQQTTF